MQEPENTVSAESKERAMAMERDAECIKNIEERLKIIEAKHGGTHENVDKDKKPQEEGLRAHGWVPPDAILGGWRPSTPRSVVEKVAWEWLQRMPEERMPHALRAEEVWRNCEVAHRGWPGAHRRVEDREDLGEERRRPQRPPWRAVARNPEEGYRRKKTSEATDKAMKVLVRALRGRVVGGHRHYEVRHRKRGPRGLLAP